MIIHPNRMVLAKKDHTVLLSIIDSVRPFIQSLANRLYNKHLIRFDRSIEFEDLELSLIFSVVTAIQTFDPEKYLLKKDKTRTECYYDGWYYIQKVLNRNVNNIMHYYARQKRIPSLKLIHYDSPYNDDETNNQLKNLLLIEKIQSIEESLYVSEEKLQSIIDMFEGKYVGTIHLYDLINKIINSPKFCITTVAKEYNVSKQYLSKLIKDKLVPVFKNITFE